MTSSGWRRTTSSSPGEVRRRARRMAAAISFVGLGELVVDQGASDSTAKRRCILLDDGDGIGPARLDGSHGQVQGVGSLAQRTLGGRPLRRSPRSGIRARPDTPRRTPLGGPPRPLGRCLGPEGSTRRRHARRAARLARACSTARPRRHSCTAAPAPTRDCDVRRQGHRHPSSTRSRRPLPSPARSSPAASAPSRR